MTAGKFGVETGRLATVALMVAGILGPICYYLFFVRGFGLLTYYNRPLLDLYRLAQEVPLARERLIAGYLLLGGLYWLAWVAAQRAAGRLAWIVVLGGALASCGVLLFLWPYGAADVFDYIGHGRILGVYGGNPFVDVIAGHPADLFTPYAAWRRTPSAYGPLWELMGGGLAWLANAVGGSRPASTATVVATHVVAFKLLGVAFLAASVATVAAILRPVAAHRALAGVVLLAWNPVVLVETAGQGHNDIVMVFWMLVAAWALLRRRYTLAILLLVAGGLVKYIPLLLLPAALLIALRELQDTRARLRFLLVTGAASLLLVVAAYAPFWQGLDVLGVQRRQEMFTSSLPAVAWAWLQGNWDAELLGKRISLLAAAATVLFALWQAGRARRDRSPWSFARAGFRTLMFYLLVACLWFQDWYAIWPLGLAALLPPGGEARLAMLLSYAALAKPLILEPLWLWVRPMPSKVWRELRLGPAILALPWLYALILWWQGLRNPQRPPLEP